MLKFLVPCFFENKIKIILIFTLKYDSMTLGLIFGDVFYFCLSKNKVTKYRTMEFLDIQKI